MQRRSAFGSAQDSFESITLGRAPGIEVSVLTLGATIHRLVVTGGDGVRRDVALAHPDPATYLSSTAYLGGTIGRYANRIAGGRFGLEGRDVQVGTHDRGQHLHGGPDGFDRRRWSIEDLGDDHVELGLLSPDGDQGFPGALTVRARFEVEGSTLRLTLSATTDAPTVVNLTSHLYLNLDGGAGTIDDHELQIAADAYTPVDASAIPYGDHAPVDGTAFDLRLPRRLADVVRSGHKQVELARGIDHNLVLGERPEGAPAAVLTSQRTRTRMELRTAQPGLQVYTGNSLDGAVRDARGGLYRQGDGIALEPQLFPDTPNHPEWPTARLDPGQTYRSTMSWTFTAIDPATGPATNPAND